MDTFISVLFYILTVDSCQCHLGSPCWWWMYRASMPSTAMRQSTNDVSYAYAMNPFIQSEVGCCAVKNSEMRVYATVYVKWNSNERLKRFITFSLVPSLRIIIACNDIFLRTVIQNGKECPGCPRCPPDDNCASLDRCETIDCHDVFCLGSEPTCDFVSTRGCALAYFIDIDFKSAGV